MLDLLIYICGALVIVGGLWLSYLGIFGHLDSKRSLGLWVLYGTLLFVLTGAFLYFQKSIWEHEAEAGASQTERAYMGISSSFVQDFTPGQQALAVMTVDNAGKTPASEVHYRANFDIRPPNSQLDWSQVVEPLPGSASSFVLPGRSIILPLKFPIPATGELFDAINKEQLIVVIYGRIFFKDSSGNPHAVEFCRFYRPNTNSLVACGTNNREVY